MSVLRLLLLAPILYSLAVVGWLGFLMSKTSALAQFQATDFHSTKEWHGEAMNSEDPESLRNHAEKLWVLFQHAEGAAESFLSSTKLALQAAIIGSTFTLVFCSAAFVKAWPSAQDRRLDRP